MSIAIMKMPMPAKSGPARSSELRKSLVRIKPDSEEAVLLFPDENATLAKLRNRASGAVAAVRETEGVFFITRTCQAVNPASEAENPQPETCVGIWKVSKDPNEKDEAKAEEKPAAKADNSAKPAAPKASNGAAAKAEPKRRDTDKAEAKPDTAPKQGSVLDSLS